MRLPKRVRFLPACVPRFGLAGSHHLRLAPAIDISAHCRRAMMADKKANAHGRIGTEWNVCNKMVI